MANNLKGLVIEIGGDTTKLGKALEDVNKKTSSLSSELGQINRLLKMDPGNTELLGQKMKVLSEAISNTEEKLTTLKKAQAQVQEQFERGEVSEEQYRALQREIVATEQKLDGYENALDETQKQLYNTEKKTKDAEKETGNFGETAAKVAEGALKAMGAALVAMGTAAAAAVKSLTDFAVGGAAYADTVLTESTVTGIATDKLQEYMYAAELIDVSTETLTKSMAKNIKSMSSAASGTGATAEAYKKLGVSVTDANGNLLDSDEVYWNLIDALGNVDNETERDAMAMQVLGKSAQELNPLIEAGAERMQELGKQAQEAGYVLSDDALNAFGEFDDQIQYLTVGAEAAKNALGTVLLPVLTDLAGEGVGLLGEFTNGVKEADGDINAIAGVISEVLPKALSAVTGLLPTVLQMASTLIDSLVQNIPMFITTIVGAIMAAAPQLLTTVVNVFSQLIVMTAEQAPALVGQVVALSAMLITAIAEQAPTIIEAVVGMIPQVIENLVACVPDLLEAAITLLMAIVQAVPEVVVALIDELPTIIDAVLAALDAALPLLLDAAIQLFMALVQALPTIIQRLGAALPKVISSITTFLINNLPLLLQAAIQLFGALIKAIPTIIVELVKALPQIISAIVKGLTSGISAIGEVGKNLVRGLWDGIKNMVGWITEKVKGFANTILGGIKNALGIHSPSKEMAWVGEMMSKGLAEGIEENSDEPLDAMASVSSGLLNEAENVDGLSLQRQLQATVNTGTDTGLLSKLDRILSAIEAGKVLTIDGDTLVGATAGKYDAALGQRQLLAARGAI